MSVMIGHASLDERGGISGGQDGDQTGGEVCRRVWYSKPWELVLRCTDELIAERLALACEAACANECVGYSQSRRHTLYAEAAKLGHDIAAIKTPCACDCSSLMAECALAAGLIVPYYLTTMTLRDGLIKTGVFRELRESRCTAKSGELMRGDILLSPGSHTAMVLSHGEAELSAPAKPVPKLYPARYRDLAKSGRYRVKAGSLNARYGPGKSYEKLTTLRHGQTVINYGYYDGDWLYCQLPGGGAGWLSGAWLEK